METFSNISDTSYDFDDDSFDDISEEATDFISKLLVKSQMERLTASQCLLHNWLGQARGMSLKTISPGMEFFITGRNMFFLKKCQSYARITWISTK